MSSPPFYRLGNRVLDLPRSCLVIKSTLGVNDLNDLGYPAPLGFSVLLEKDNARSAGLTELLQRRGETEL